MPEGVQKAERSTRQHTTRKRRSTSDDEESQDDVHVKVEAIFPANTPSNTALVRRGKIPVHSEHDSSDSEEYSESEEEELPNKRKRRSSRSSEPHIPTEDELKRYERLLHLKARAATIAAAQGNVYEEVNVGENARVIQGNAFAEEHPESALLLRKHTYKKTGAVGNGEVIVGDVTVSVMERFFRQHKKQTRQRSKSKSKRGGYFRNGDPVPAG